VIARRNRIELVVVAAGAGNGQAQQTTGYRVNAIIERLGFRLGDAVRIAAVGGVQWSQNQKARGDCRLASEQVTGNLLLDELIIGKIAIERLNDPIAITIGLRP